MVSLTVAEMLGRAPTPPRFAAMLDPSLEALLMDAAPDPGEFASVRGLLEGCLRALWDMARLDDALEAAALICDPVQPPKGELEHIHYFCGNVEIAADLAGQSLGADALAIDAPAACLAIENACPVP